MRSLSGAKLKELRRLLTPRTTSFIQQTPTEPQTAFLLLPAREALYGGAAGGGKSSALLMAALQYVDVPGYSAILFRRTYADLSRSGALMDRAAAWLRGTSANWNEQRKTWSFPSGATLSFGYLETENDKYSYQGAEFQFVGFDELTQFRESQYRYLFSRLRRLKGAGVPLRMRAASNPGGEGHDWVFARFFTDRQRRVFIPARLEDNPYLDEDYEESLAELDPVTRRQLRNGDWSARKAGEMFDRTWFEVVDAVPPGARRVRFWDLAATEAKKGKRPDFTVGVKLAEHKGQYWVEDVRRFQKRPAGVEAEVRAAAELDGVEVPIHMEQEPGSSGVNTIDHYARTVLKGFAFHGERSTGDKQVRARPVSAAAEKRNIRLVRAAWNAAYLDELEAFPEGGNDDQVDAMSGALAKLTRIDIGKVPSEVREPERTGLGAMDL